MTVNQTVLLIPRTGSQDPVTAIIPLEGLLPPTVDHGGRTYALRAGTRVPLPQYEELSLQVPAHEPAGGASHSLARETHSEPGDGSESRAVPGVRGDVEARQEREQRELQAHRDVAGFVVEALTLRRVLCTEETPEIRAALEKLEIEFEWRAQAGRAP